MQDELRITRRDLPHWDLAGSLYSVTWRLKHETPEMCPDERTLVMDALKFFEGQRYHLFAWVVMNDHVHVMFQPLGEHTRSSILHSWKSYTANRMQRKFGRQGTVWQDESWDRIIRCENEALETWDYIIQNPRRRWPGIKSYPWVSIFPE